jgi:phosphoglycerate dehydrogenase-like enzyme
VNAVVIDALFVGCAIAVVNAPESNFRAVVEFTLGLILAERYLKNFLAHNAKK